MARRLHVAYVCADRGVPVGGRKGASAHVLEMSQALARAGAEVQIVAARTDEDLENGGFPVPVVDLGGDRANRQMRQLLFGEARTAARRARASEAHGLLFNSILARELDKLHRRWRIDAVYERYSLWSHAGAAFARGMRLPHLLEVNAPLRQEQARYRALENDRLAADLEGYLFRSADYVLVPSAELRPYVVAHGARPGAARVVANAADPRLFASAPAAPHEGFVIGFLGTLKPWHGLTHLIRAFVRLRRLSPEYRLLIAGDGPERSQLTRLLRRHGLGRAATFTGEVAHAEVPAVLAQMDVAVAPYPPLRGFYFSPLKVFEYMAAGVPVVASDIGQIGATLRHGETALLHRPGAVDEMVAQIERLRRQPLLRTRLQRAARALVRRRFTWERNAEKVLQLIAVARRRRQREGTRGSH